MLNLLDINKEVFFKKHGFFKIKNPENFNFLELLENVKKIDTDTKHQESGYSTDIYDLLDDDIKFKLNQLANKYVNYDVVKKYLSFPSLLKIRVLKSKFNEKAFQEPTHAMLWHRDFDDVFSQLKFIIPLSFTTISNGAFTVSSKQIAARSTMFVDKNMLDKLNKSNNTYRKKDESRITDKTFKKKFGNFIYEYIGDSSDILIVDTNRCYHKGGQVLTKGLERYMVHFHIGSPTNSFHPNMNLKKKKLSNLIHYFVGRLVRIFVQFYFFVMDKKINSKKKLLD